MAEDSERTVKNERQFVDVFKQTATLKGSQEMDEKNPLPYLHDLAEHFPLLPTSRNPSWILKASVDQMGRWSLHGQEDSPEPITM